MPSREGKWGPESAMLTAVLTNVLCHPDQEVTPMSLPRVTSIVMRYQSGGRPDELRAVRKPTLQIGLER